MTTNFDLLREHPFLAGIPDEQVARLSTWARRSVFHAGQRVFSDGGRADGFWLIREGRVDLDTLVPGRGTEVVETLGPGAVLGWSWLFHPYRWHYGAVAREPTLTVALNGAGVRALCDADPVLGYELTRRFMRVLVHRLQNTRMRLLDLYRAPP
jgi:CRP/FNR family cyclic AMP-dependent transcriptional regulator